MEYKTCRVILIFNRANFKIVNSAGLDYDRGPQLKHEELLLGIDSRLISSQICNVEIWCTVLALAHVLG